MNTRALEKARDQARSRRESDIERRLHEIQVRAVYAFKAQR